MPLFSELASLGRPPKVILLGSGGLSIGQAGEFDYSGTQAVKAMREEGIHVIVINPNIATVQTNPEEGVKIYLYPVELEWVTRVIETERPDGIVAGFGGQTALNCLMKLDESGVLAKYKVRNLGTPADILRLTEDRDTFAQHMKQIGMPVAPSVACDTVESAAAAATKIGFPVIVRAAFALGGLGSGFANNQAELENLVSAALTVSPQVLVEKSLKGWKEVEYEVMRDSVGNAITICNMENLDPLGIHTGDSIVACPSQSLSDDDYQVLRNACLLIVNSLGIVGECNVQFALSPHSLEFYIIEINARLSRSSALASKASGYPIAYIAAKVVLGYDLLELKNPVTGITQAFFEPALDYITIKFPRWDLRKFPGVNRVLGSTMKSVGEIMSIGRNFPEAIQKAVRMVTEDPIGLSHLRLQWDESKLREELQNPTDNRLFAVVEALRYGMTKEQIHELSAIDKWFLFHFEALVKVEQEITAHAKKHKGAASAQLCQQMAHIVTAETWKHWKQLGFGDEQIAYLWILGLTGDSSKASNRTVQDWSLIIRKAREDRGVKPVIKKIDTTSAEYPSPSNYLYVTYGGQYHDPMAEDDKIFSAIVLGGGSYRIGTSVEFDWCAVSCSKRLRESGWRSVIINCNPETVSTDFNNSDRLYFEELTLERILDIAGWEKIVGVIASMGGQLPNKLALPLARAGIKLLGHRPETIDMAEDRSKFSALLDKLGIDQPRWVAATTQSEVKKFTETVGFPILVRPSYVLSGAAMNVAYDAKSLDICLSTAADISTEHPVVLSEFLEGAREIELDGVARNGEILTAIVSEHIENAGVHSGDATMVVPAQNLYVETVRRVRAAASAIARGLQLNGPFNIQFLAKSGKVKVIECNARAARSFPFVSKTVGLNLANASTDIIMGKQPHLSRLNEDELPYVGVKAPMFSFTRLLGADPILGVEMASTGEVGCIGHNFDTALLLAMQASGIKTPKKGVLVSSGPEKEKLKFLEAARIIEQLGLPMYATKGTADYLRSHDIKVIETAWPDGTSRDVPDVITVIKKGLVDLVINIPKNNQRAELTNGARVRQAATRFGASLITNMEKTLAFIKAIDNCQDFVKSHDPLPLPPFRS